MFLRRDLRHAADYFANLAFERLEPASRRGLRFAMLHPAARRRFQPLISFVGRHR